MEEQPIENQQGQSVSTVTHSTLNDQCPNCEATVLAEFDQCPNCMYPLKGTDEQKQEFKTNHAVNKFLLEKAESKIKRATTVLYVLAVFALLGAILLYYMSAKTEEDTIGFTLMLLLSAAYAGLAYFSKKHPTRYLAIGLVLLLSAYVLDALVDPSTIFRGLLFKILFIGFLIQGVKSAYEGEKIKKKMSGIE